MTHLQYPGRHYHLIYIIFCKVGVCVNARGEFESPEKNREKQEKREFEEQIFLVINIVASSG